MTVIDGNINTIHRQSFVQIAASDTAQRSLIVDSNGNEVSVDSNGNLNTIAVISDTEGDLVKVTDDGHLNVESLIVGPSGDQAGVDSNGQLKTVAVLTDSGGDTASITSDGNLNVAALVLGPTGNKAAVNSDGQLSTLSMLVGSDGYTAGINSTGQLKVVLDGKVDPNNTTKVPLLANATFTGTATETLDYAIVYISVYSNVASATNGLKIDSSSDGLTWYSSDEYTIPAATDKTFSFQANRRYFRLRYTNGATNQTTFDLECVMKKGNGKPSSHRVQDNISDEDDGELVKAVITGKKSNGTYTNFSATNSGNFKVSIEEFESGVSTNSNTQLRVTPYSSTGVELLSSTHPSYVQFPATYFDMFGKLVTAMPNKLFEYTACYPIDTTRYWVTAENTGATVSRNATKTQIELKTTTASGSQAIMQSRRNIQYNKGNAQEILLIYRPNPIANRTERWGYFDANNGIFFEHDGTNPRLVIRSNTSGTPVDTKIERSAWDDKLDGSGASGLTIDWTKQTVFKIEFGWLSSRGVRFCIDVSGTFVCVKTWLVSNTLTVPYMRTANLPIRVEASNSTIIAQETISSMSCVSVLSSGAGQQEGRIRILSSGATAANLTTTETIFAGIRINSNYPNASLKLQLVELLPVSGTTSAYYKIIYNPTLVGDAWTAGESGVWDYLTGVTSFSNGSVIADGFFALASASSTRNATVQELLSDVYVGKGLTTYDALVLVIRTTTSTGTALWSLEFKEFV